MNTQDSENEGCYVSPPVTEQGADMQGRIGEIARPPLDTGITPVGGSAGDGKHAERPFGQSPVSLRQNVVETRSYGSRSYVTITSSAYTKLTSENSRCKASIHRLQEDLWREKARVTQLKEEIRDQENVIAKVHSNAISLLSSNVSSNLPDDKIRRGLSNLFDGIVRDWCLDIHATDDIDESGAATVLMSNNILADAPDLPAHLKINMRDETAAPVLLQAALAKFLCDSFLMEPFFLQDWLPRASDAAFTGTNLHAITTWRVQTVEFLEVTFPPSKHYFRERAEDFTRKYACLLQQVHEDALLELSELMEQFCKLALQLWKRHVLISVEGLEQQDLKHFRSAQPDMEAEDSVLHGARGAHLDGRPVQVMVRPRIVSEPVHQDGQLADRVPAGLQADRALREENAKTLSLIAVMGVTGSGKSNFLQHLIGKGREKGPTVGHNLSSCTQKTEMYECRLGNKQVVFFDTPGFDDTYRGDADVLADVAQVLSSSYKNNLKLNGIIYLHRIKDERMTNAIMRNLTMFRNLCGDAAFQNVALVTTFWDELQDQSKGEDREQQLLARGEWWGYMTGKGSKTMRFHNTRESALEIVSKVIDLDIVTLQVQEEMVHRGLEVDQTTAGEALNSELAEQRRAFEKALQTLHHEKEQAKRDHDVHLQEIIETMELEKMTLLQEIESEQAALHADRREERRRMEQEFYDEKLRLERMVQEVLAESVRIKKETETEAREERRRMKAEFDGKLHDFSEQQSQEVQKIVREFEQRLAAEKEDGHRRLREALESSDAVIRDLKNSMNRSRREDRRKYEEEIKNIKRRQREAKEQSERWVNDMERINREILASQVEQRDADKKEQGGIQTKLDKLKEQKKSKTQIFWSRIGALAGVGSLLLAALA
ncbi:hypothetical protein MRS44_016463 [Fusarium solani]|uniref:uncharacterized protein n=1 Tax=Fusarium solani TaxID=169388 RepID=UPI0032C3E0CE|nr:hypothetical protein MRS44_016463 [Fusarium solani]